MEKELKATHDFKGIFQPKTTLLTLEPLLKSVAIIKPIFRVAKC